MSQTFSYRNIWVCQHRKGYKKTPEYPSIPHPISHLVLLFLWLCTVRLVLKPPLQTPVHCSAFFDMKTMSTPSNQAQDKVSPCFSLPGNTFRPQIHVCCNIFSGSTFSGALYVFPAEWTMFPGGLYTFQQSQLPFRGAFCLLAGYVGQVWCHDYSAGNGEDNTESKERMQGQSTSLWFHIKHWQWLLPLPNVCVHENF